MKILITGVAGFIGFHLAKALVKRSTKIIGIDNLNNYYDPSLKLARLTELGISIIQEKGIINSENSDFQSDKYSNLTFKKLDLNNRKAIEQLFQKEQFDIVVNLAAQAGVRHSLKEPHAYVESNVMGFLNILEGCRNQGVKHLVYASSSSIYGLNKKIPLSSSDNVDHPISLYAATKKSNELMAHTYSHLFNIPTTGLRFFTVYGPWGRPDMAYFLFTEAIVKGKPIKVYNKGKMSRDFTYIDDIIDGLLKVINHPPKGDNSWSGKCPSPASSLAPYRLYNIGNSHPIALMDFIKTIEEKIGQKAIKHFLPIQPGDVEITYADIEDLKQELGYQPKTNVQEGISAFINWYKSYFKIVVNDIIV